MEDRIKNNDNKEDLKLVRRAKRGNRNAFGKLVLKYQQRIYFTVRRVVLNHSDTNDIVQDTFVKAFVNLNRFDENYAFYPWLYRIAINTILNHQIKISRIKETFTSSEGDSIQQVRLTAADPLEEVLKKEFKDKVAKALRQLPFDQRIVFTLRTSEDLSYQEISELLNISIGTVMSRLSRARAKLKEQLQNYLS